MSDGAIVANNPVLVALSEAALLWPGAPIDVLVSVGTGTNQPRPFPASPGPMAWLKQIVELSMNPFVAHKIVSTLLGPGGGFGKRPYQYRRGALGDVDGAADGEDTPPRYRRRRGGSGVAIDASAQRYWRFDVEGVGDIDIAETREAVLAAMVMEGRRYIQRNQPLFSACASALVTLVPHPHAPPAGP